MEITEIKNQLSITTVLAHYSLIADKNHRLACPFHEDSTPSMQVYPKTNTVFCFSSNCPMHGKAIDSIDFIMHKENITKHEALKKATTLIGVPTEIPVKSIESKPIEENNLNELMKLLQQNTKKSKEAKDYIHSRALELKKLEIGYNTSTISHLKHCIVFGLKDKENNTVSLYGRSIHNNTDQKHFYLANRKGIYPGYPNPKTENLILTESIIDAASLLQIPFIKSNYSTIACYGTNGLNEEIKNSIIDLKHLKEIIFLFDNDEAGNTAVSKYTEELKVLPNIILSKIVLPCKDVNETLETYGDDIFMRLLSNKFFLHPTYLAVSTIKEDLIFSNEKENQQNKIQPSQEPMQETQSSQQAEQSVKLITTRLNTTNPEQVNYNTDELLITLLGGISLQNLDRLRVTIYLRRNPHINAQQSIRQNIDLYQDDIVEKFIRKAAEKLDHGTTLISSVIAQMTEDIEAWRLQQIESKKVSKAVKKELTAEEKTRAVKYLEREDLMQWTSETLLNTGIVGEAENAMILNIAMTSRLYEDPVSVICLSQSGTGKSYLLERVAKCFPTEDIIENTQFTDNSFFYWKDGIKGKIILIEDMEGAQNVEYPMRELITKKYITKTTVHKDAKGNMQTVQYRVEGPATFLGCTTKEKIYEDNANRCILIYLDSSKAQDKNIIEYHKRNRAGIVDKQGEQASRQLLINMQSLLQSKKIINPYATLIDLPESVLKPRRSIGILLSFIEAITLYHQYQCKQEQGVLITHPTHIEWGFKLLKESLFRKSDELSAAVRNFLESVQRLLVKGKKQSFYAMDIRQELQLHPRTLRRYLYELHDYGYIKITGGNKYKKGYEYELTSLATANHLQSTIDKHIEAVMQKIWKAHKAQTPEQKSIKKDSRTAVGQTDFVLLNNLETKGLRSVGH
jgi:DNA primase